MNSLVRTRGRFLAIAAGAAVLMSCAAPGAQPGQPRVARADERQCFYSPMVNGFTPVGRDRVHVTVGANTIYELTTIGYCPEIDWSRQIAIRPTGGGNWICRGYDAELLVPGVMGGRNLDKCPVTGIRRLTPEEVKARRRR